MTAVLLLTSYCSDFHIGAFILFHAVEICARARLIPVNRFIGANENNFVRAGTSALGCIFFRCLEHAMFPSGITQIRSSSEKVIPLFSTFQKYTETFSLRQYLSRGFIRYHPEVGHIRETGAIILDTHADIL
jgi:hypothetical protein